MSPARFSGMARAFAGSKPAAVREKPWEEQTD
jgi:hypothetical protein